MSSNSTAADNKSSFVPALGFEVLTPLYQTVVDVFCRDTIVKQTLLSKIHGENMRILDVACGPGKLVSMLAQQQHCCNVTGMDIDPTMVETARQATRNIANVTIVQGDVTKTPFKNDEQFDVVIESLLLHHLDDSAKRLALVEIRRSLARPNGLFYFVDWVKPSTVFSSVGFQLVKLLDGNANLAVHENDEIFRIIKESGFEMLPGEKQLIETTVGTLAIVVFKLASENNDALKTN